MSISHHEPRVTLIADVMRGCENSPRSLSPRLIGSEISMATSCSWTRTIARPDSQATTVPELIMEASIAPGLLARQQPQISPASQPDRFPTSAQADVFHYKELGLNLRRSRRHVPSLQTDAIRAKLINCYSHSNGANDRGNQIPCGIDRCQTRLRLLCRDTGRECQVPLQRSAHDSAGRLRTADRLSVCLPTPQRPTQRQATRRRRRACRPTVLRLRASRHTGAANK